MAAAKKPHPPRDSIREVVETIVFVVALVLMLKLFVVEAFVIPTGSMAETLLGYNKLLTCPECGHEFPVNASNEVDPQDGILRPLTGATCPNCRNRFELVPAGRVAEAATRAGPRQVAADPGPRSGDRVLVLKALYSASEPDRGDVVVFKYPVDPQLKHTAQNYIKRLWGRGDETIAVWRGDLYVARGITYPEAEGYPRPEDDRNLWQGPLVFDHSKTSPPFRSLGTDFTYHNREKAYDAFEASRREGFPGGPGKFELIRKTDAQLLAMRRITYHNEHQSDYLARKGVPPRWRAVDGGWKADSPTTPKTFTHSGDEFDWLRYAHRTPAPTEPPAVFNGWGQPNQPPPTDWHRVADGYDAEAGAFPPSPVTNFLGYNAGIEGGADARTGNGDYWVGDLVLECRATVSGPADEVVLELSKGVNRFQARFTGGRVTLVRVGPRGGEMASAAAPVTGGSYDLRFANVDDRLRVWVDGSAIDLGKGAEYNPADTLGFEDAVGAVTGVALAPRANGLTVLNDVLAPAGVGARGAVEVGRLVLWQDTFFTPTTLIQNHANPDDPVDTYYVHPGHYLCLGDNSGQSSDSRVWGLVPERLLLGKAVFVFWPFSLSDNRLGFIR